MGFTEEEIAFMAAQPLARIATIDDEGQPDSFVPPKRTVHH